MKTIEGDEWLVDEEDTGLVHISRKNETLGSFTPSHARWLAATLIEVADLAERTAKEAIGTTATK